MTNQELAKVHGDSPVRKVEEHEPTGVRVLDADGQLVREAAHSLA